MRSSRRCRYSESTLARLYTLVRTDPERDVTVDIERIERRIATCAPGRTACGRNCWRASRRNAHKLAGRFADAFPTACPEDVTARDAIGDILGDHESCPETAPALGLQLRPGDRGHKALHLRLYRRGEPVAM